MFVKIDAESAACVSRWELRSNVQQIIHGLLNSPALEFARSARSRDKSVRVGAVPTAGRALAACDTRPARRRRAPLPPGRAQPTSTMGKTTTPTPHADVSLLIYYECILQCATSKMLLQFIASLLSLLQLNVLVALTTFKSYVID